MSSAEVLADPEAIRLGPASDAPLRTLTRPVFFIGFMGAGKTSVSRKLARQQGLAVVDADTFLERQEGRTVKEIFAEQGEDGFRALETQVLKDLSRRTPMLISCGGGVVLREENRQILKDAGFVVFLKVSAAEARDRISDLSSRPLFNDLEQANQRNLQRLPLYEEVADLTIDTAGKSVSAIAREVQSALKKEGVLCVQKR